MMAQQAERFEVQLHDGSTIEVEMYGDRPTILMPVNPHPAEGELAETMRQYGNDPALGQNLIRGLSDVLRVVAFDYEGHVLRVPKPHTLTPENVVQDILAIADAAHADRFAYYGYSWLALIGQQLAMRTDRLSALIMGGYPPVDGPYADMLRVTNATYELASGTRPTQPDDYWGTGGLSVEGAQQFLTLYQALVGFDDRAAQSLITCPRLCFAGSADNIQYGAMWDNAYVTIGEPVVRNQAELRALGWDVSILDGLDHTQAMQPPQVLAVIRPWLIEKLIPRPSS